MSGKAKREYLRAIRGRYRRAGRREKSRILDEFCAVCGFGRKHAIRLLNRPAGRARKRPGPKPVYGQEVLRVIKTIWLAAEQMCSKRLKAALPLWLPYYEQRYGCLEPEIRDKVLRISPASIDRLLRPLRARYSGRGLSGTKPGTLLRNQIPIRTSNWDIEQPGFVEADSVAHCGNSLAGSFVWSLTFTDIYSTWTENRAVWNKGAEGVVAQVHDVESRIPFDLLGFDCDNGSEFLNHHLWRYFADRERPVAFTRSRPYHKDDNAHVEQKQWTHVRQIFGYERFHRPELVPLMNNLYRLEWSRLQNFFCPTMKLLHKQRIGARYHRRHDLPKTPCQRLLESPHVSPETKQQLRRTLETLDPFEIRNQMERKLRKIFTALREKPTITQPVANRADQRA